MQILLEIDLSLGILWFATSTHDSYRLIVLIVEGQFHIRQLQTCRIDSCCQCDESIDIQLVQLILDDNLYFLQISHILHYM